MPVIDVVAVVVRLAIGAWLLWSVRTIGSRRGEACAGDQAHSVSVIVPARDEAETLPNLLGSLPSGVEVVVVDDHSSDATASVAESFGATVVAAPPLPAGWIGKSWACHQGAAVAVGDLLVFVDADVCFDSGGFAAVADTVADAGGLVSVQPFHEPGRPVESLASVFNIVGFAGTDAGSPLGRRRGVRGAFGPVLATSRTDYDAVGGHAAVRSSVVDDVALAARYRSAGLPVDIWAGGDQVSFRMYPRGLPQMVEGFTKNLSAGVRSIRWVTAAMVVAWFTLLVQASVAPVRELAAGDGAGLGVAVGLYAVVAAQYWWMARRLGRFGPLVALVFPVSVVVFLAVFTRSVVATATGRATWRGRTLGGG